MRAFTVIFVGVAVLVVVFGLNYFDYFNFGFFAPRYEQVRRNTFEQSQAYTEGQRRDISNLSLDWHDPSKTPAQKSAIRALALQRIIGLPPNVRDDPTISMFYTELMGSN